MTDLDKRIAKYRSGRMSPGEKAEFEADLNKDPRLKQEYMLTGIASDILIGEADLDRILNDPELPEAERIVENWIKEERKNQRSYNITAWIYLAAASVFFAFIVYKSFIIPQRTEKVFLSFYEKIDPSEFDASGIPAESLAAYHEAMSLYASGDYAGSASSFRKLYESGNENPDIILMLGITEMESGEINDALKLFKKVEALDGENAQYASFYAGLCHIKLGDPRAAVIYLADITGITEKLHPSAQKMMHRAYLVYTFQFKQFKKEVSEEEEPAAVMGPTQKRIFIGAFVFIFLLMYMTVLVANRKSLHSKRAWIWLTVIFLLPIGGSTIYLILFRKKKA